MALRLLPPGGVWHPLLRPFRFQPLYALACVPTLALAVAATVTSLAVVKRAILDPLPYEDGDRLVALGPIGCIVALITPLLALGQLALHIMAMVKGVNGQRLIIPGLSEFADKF